ncbi:30S ribosomal protein S15 [Patescibacteria group bacterium]|nr:MAG: 30S ribosomal protein S15 [Patescibacteria group bacterium]
MISKTKKKRLIGEAKIHEKDTGSPEVQITILTRRIEELAKHLKKHKKDHHSRRGLLGMVSSRQAQMNYLQKKSSRRFNALMKKLKLKKRA